jgi:hypothetical protein
MFTITIILVTLHVYQFYLVIPHSLLLTLIITIISLLPITSPNILHIGYHRTTDTQTTPSHFILPHSVSSSALQGSATTAELPPMLAEHGPESIAPIAAPFVAANPGPTVVPLPHEEPQEGQEPPALNPNLSAPAPTGAKVIPAPGQKSLYSPFITLSVYFTKINSKLLL